MIHLKKPTRTLKYNPKVPKKKKKQHNNNLKIPTIFKSIKIVSKSHLKCPKKAKKEHIKISFKTHKSLCKPQLKSLEKAQQKLQKTNKNPSQTTHRKSTQIALKTIERLRKKHTHTHTHTHPTRLASSSYEEHCPNSKSKAHVMIHNVATKTRREFVDGKIQIKAPPCGFRYEIERGTRVR